MHRLALKLGGRTVAEWCEVMKPGEFLTWAKFYAEEPFGAPWEDALQAKQTSALVNMWSKARVKISQFLYKGPAKQEQQNKSETEKVFDLFDRIAEKGER